MNRLAAILPIPFLFLFAAHASAAGAPDCLTAGITAPVALTSHAPTPEMYPPLSAMMGESGATVVHYTIDADGGVTIAAVSRSSGSLRLDDAAVTFVKTFKFKPGLQNDKPVACSREIAVDWRLNGGNGTTAFAQIAGPPLLPTKDDYPAGAYDRGEEGTAIAMILTDEKGAVTALVPILGTRFPDLNEATSAYLHRQKIVGATINGTPVRSAVIVRVVWSLSGKAPVESPVPTQGATQSAGHAAIPDGEAPQH